MIAQTAIAAGIVTWDRFGRGSLVSVDWSPARRVFQSWWYRYGDLRKVGT